MKRQKGFSLIELMIAVAIVAIIAAIAVPSYNSQIQKTRRADAKTALTTAASMQERFYMRNNSYSANMDDLGGSGGTLQSPEGYYTLTSVITGCPNSQPNGSCYTLTAAPVSGGPQDNDSHCASFSLSDTAARTANNTDCW